MKNPIAAAAPGRISYVLTCCCLLGLASPSLAKETAHAFFAARIWPAASQPIDDAVLLVQRGKIVAVGPRSAVAVPANAQRHELGPLVIIPGLVIAETSLAEAGRDDTQAITPQVRAVDGFDFFGDYDAIVAGGVTTVQVAPGGRRLMPGQGSVVKLAGNSPSEQILRETESLRIILSRAALNPPTIYEPPVGAVSVDRPLETTKPQLATSLASAVAGLRAIFRTSIELASQDSDLEVGDLLEAVSDCQQNGRVVRLTAQSAAEIRAALQLSREFNWNTILVDPVGLRPFLKRTQWSSPSIRGIVLNAGVRPGRVTDPQIPDRDQPPLLTAWESAARLAKRDAQHKLAIRPAADADLPDILFLAGLFRRGGLSAQQVLQMVTHNPATMLGVADRVGSLAQGKDADFVVLSQDPFQSGARVMATYIGGRPIYDRKRDAATKVIRAAKIYTGDGIQSGSSVVVVGRKITGLGEDVSSPPDADVRQFPNGVVVPGFIDLGTGLGLGGPLRGRVSLETKLGERLFPGDPAVEFARQGGVTTALLSSSSAPAPVLAFKLGDHPRAIKDPVALRFAISGNLTSAAASMRRTLESGKRYAETWSKYDKDYAEYQAQLKVYEAAKAKYDAAVKAAAAAKKKKEAEQKKQDSDKSEAGSKAKKEADDSQGGSDDEEKEDDKDQPAKSEKNDTKSDDKKDTDKQDGDEKKAADKQDQATAKLKAPVKPKEPKKPRKRASSEPYRALFAKQIPAIVEAGSAKAVELAVELFQDDFKLEMILAGADNAKRNAESLGEKQVPVVVGPVLVNRIDGDLINAPQVYANARVPFGFLSQSTTGVRELPLAVQYAVHQGLGRSDALAGLTTMPARFLKLDSVGSLGPGKDADLVVLSGPPFELSSRVLAVMIDGEWVYEREAAE